MLKKDDFYYKLPKKLIANAPIKPRDHSNLMILTRKTGEIETTKFFKIANFLTDKHVLVFNDTKVFPARLFGYKETGGRIEFLILSFIKNTAKAIFKGNLKVGQKIIFKESYCIVDDTKENIVHLVFEKNVNVLDFLNEYGTTPLPPYIHSNSKEINLRKSYQTVYAKSLGSAAAPTAGFHFTKKLLEMLKDKGVQIEYITLHVGLGTFLPIKEEYIENHKMHSEYFEVNKKTWQNILKAKKEGKKIVSVGTTSLRVLESLFKKEWRDEGDKYFGETDIFIYPPSKFKIVDSLITNFHLPHSTLLALISAFVSFPNTENKFINFKTSLAGVAYKKAIDKSFRFYSFGDSMFII